MLSSATLWVCRAVRWMNSTAAEWDNRLSSSSLRNATAGSRSAACGALTLPHSASCMANAYHIRCARAGQKKEEPPSLWKQCRPEGKGYHERG
eukprot:1147622-Pelagomonas_calceolata.AAC.3